VLDTVVQDFGATAQHHPAEPPPIFVPSVDHEGGLRVFQDVSQPL
jgi:hypothetical protein